MDDILQRILDQLTIPDILVVLGGNWEPVERVRPVLQSYIHEELKGDPTPQQLEVLATQIISSIQAGFERQPLPEVHIYTYISS